ncbi:MAG: hypothetical protein ACOYO2_05260 [Mycobacterium sp.]
MDKICVAAICSLNYFADALGLVESVFRFHPELHYYIFIVDRSDDDDLHNKLAEMNNHANIIWIDELKIPELSAMIEKYSVGEMNLAVRPSVFKYLLSDRKYDKIFYVDADIRLFADLSETIRLLDTSSILLTPHLVGPEEDEDTEMSSLDDFLQYGIYNLGFLGLKNDRNSEKFLDWWHSKLIDRCFLAPERFLFGDQKWIDFAPALFDKVHILRSPGYNMAFWNLQKRIVTRQADGYLVNGEHRLVFYHFSHYNPLKREYIADLDGPGQTLVNVSSRPDLAPLFDYYNQTLSLMNFNYFSGIKYNL